jgi:20S proteasome alpha/beta subunit
LTTIAFRDGVLVSDSKITGNGIFVGEYQKIFKLTVEEQLSWIDRIVFRKEPEQIDYLVGAAGSVEDFNDFIECIFFGAQREKAEYDCSVIAVSCDENDEYSIRMYDGTNLKGFEVKAKYAAIGSGSPIALGALYQGATAEEAVQAAMHHDNGSGGEIQKVSFTEDE